MSLAPVTKEFDSDHALRIATAVISPGQILRAFLLFALLAVIAYFALTPGTGHAATPSEADRFQGFVQNLWPQAHARKVSRATFDLAFKDMSPDPDVLAKTQRQPEFSKPIGQYLATATSAARIETGQAKAQAWKDTLEHVDARYGVDAYIVLGVWGMETDFGGHTGDMSTIRSLATLAFAHYRGDYFKRELLDALDVLQAGHVAAADMSGSWAGAMGQTQFMPSSFKRYAVDFDGDGRKDIWKSVPDALGSTAFYLKRHGWVAGEPWGFEVTLPRGFDAAAASASRPKSFGLWAAEGMSRADGGAMPKTGEAALLLPAGPDGPVFLVTHNFKVIKSYNNSTSYALGVALLSDRVAGWGPLKTAWPVAQR